MVRFVSGNALLGGDYRGLGLEYICFCFKLGCAKEISKAFLIVLV
jgi:hypothetical protein